MNRNRRVILQHSGLAGAVGLAWTTGLISWKAAFAAESSQAIYDSHSLSEVLRFLGAEGALESREIIVKAPEVAGNGAVVPIDIISNLPHTESIALIVEKNDYPMIADFALMYGAMGFVSVRIRMAESSNVVVLVRADGRLYSRTKLVKVTLGGCGGADGGQGDQERAEKRSRSARQIRIHAAMAGDAVDIKCLMNHIQETGLRKDLATGRIIPAHYITHVSAEVGGRKVLDAHWGRGISRNPYLALKVRGTRVGEKVSIAWEDNWGDKGIGDTTITS
jgi:sulfur-oxidizing protein SoxY